MRLHHHCSDPGNFCLEIRVGLGSKGVLALGFLSLHSGLCPHRFNVRFQWLGPQCSLHGIKRNPGDSLPSKLCSASEHGGTGKAHRMRKVERGKQERAARPGLWAWGKSAMNRNRHKKTQQTKPPEIQVKVKNRTKDQMGEKTQAGKNSELRLGRRSKGRTVVISLCGDKINYVLGGGWMREGGKICRVHCCHTSEKWILLLRNHLKCNRGVPLFSCT